MLVLVQKSTYIDTGTSTSPIAGINTGTIISIGPKKNIGTVTRTGNGTGTVISKRAGIADLQISKSPIGPTKNLERLYNRVVVCLVVLLIATLVITASSHSKCCPADQTRSNDQDDQDDPDY